MDTLATCLPGAGQPHCNDTRATTEVKPWSVREVGGYWCQYPTVTILGVMYQHEAHTEVMTSIEQTADSQSAHLNCYSEHDIAQEVSMLAVMEQV